MNGCDTCCSHPSTSRSFVVSSFQCGRRNTYEFWWGSLSGIVLVSGSYCQLLAIKPGEALRESGFNMAEIERRLNPAHAASSSCENRLSIPFGIRFPAATGVAFVTGLSMGLSHGAKTAGLRFRAENSHRFPTTSTGWYLYHKSKNYHMMLGGIKEGLKMGSKIAFWAGGFFLVEEAVDRLRGTKDFVSTVVAGLSISGGFSAWSNDTIGPIV